MNHSTARRGAYAMLGIAAFSLAGMLVGCSILPSPYPPGYVEKRKANLDAAVAEFNASSVAPIVCDWAGGYVGLNNGYTHDYIFSGSDSVTAVVDRLNDLGYGVGGDETLDRHFQGVRPGGIGVSGTVVLEGGEEVSAFLKEFAEHKCIIPAAGAVVVELREG